MMVFLIEPGMHEEVNFEPRIVMLLSFCLIVLPLFFLSEYCMIYYYNEVVRIFQKSEDQETLLSKTGNPLYVY